VFPDFKRYQTVFPLDRSRGPQSLTVEDSAMSAELLLVHTVALAPTATSSYASIALGAVAVLLQHFISHCTSSCTNFNTCLPPAVLIPSALVRYRTSSMDYLRASGSTFMPFTSGERKRTPIGEPASGRVRRVWLVTHHMPGKCWVDPR